MAATRYVCSRCGVNVGYWYFGWKHQSGWHGKPTCGQKPNPIPAPPTQQPTKESK